VILSLVELDKLNEIVSNIEKELYLLDDVRERTIRVSRDILRISRIVIACIHQDKIDEAREKLRQLSKLVDDLMEMLKDYDELKFSGFVRNSLVEYVEAHLFYAVVTKSDIPSPEDLKVSPSTYILGLADSGGEIRRRIIALLNQGNIDEVKRMYDILKQIYHRISTIVIPDAIAPGLRSKCDMLRNSVERVGSEIIYFHLTRSIRGINDENSK